MSHIDFFGDRTVVALSTGSLGATGFGYWAGGTSSTTTTVLSSMEKTLFPTETTVAIGAALTTARQGAAGVAEGACKGYFAGGSTESTGAAGVTTADRVAFAGDTTSAQTTANLTQGRHSLTGVTEGQTKGYFCGGNTATAVSVGTANKITFSTDTTAAQTTANLTTNRSGPFGVPYYSVKAYLAGGRSNNASYQTTTDKLTFSSDTTAAQTTANLSSIRGHCGGLGGSGDRGYCCGGAGGVTTDKIAFATDTLAAVTTANGTVSRAYGNGIAEGTVRGYVTGGDNASQSNCVIADRITYTTDVATATTTANLVAPRVNQAAMSTVPANTSLTTLEVPINAYRGLSAAGTGQTQATYLITNNDASSEYEYGVANLDGNTFQRLDVYHSSSGNAPVTFSAGTKRLTVTVSGDALDGIQRAATVTWTLAEAVAAGQSVYLNPTSGTAYLASDATGYGGYPVGLVAEAGSAGGAVQVVTAGVCSGLMCLGPGSPQYLSGVRGRLTGALPTGTVFTSIGVALSTSGVLVAPRTTMFYPNLPFWGYVGGGLTSGGGQGSTNVEKYVMATEVASSLGSALSQGRYLLAGLSAGGKGYACGGLSSGSTGAATVDLARYVTDTVAASATAVLTAPAWAPVGLSGEGTKGYVMGGYADDTINDIANGQIFSYPIDATWSAASAALSAARRELAALSEGLTKGYSCGGYVTATTDKTTYSTDTTAAQTAANLPQTMWRTATVSFPGSKGYVAGGSSTSDGLTIVSSTYRIVYSTEAFTAVTTANLTSARSAAQGMSEGTAYGYFLGGDTVGDFSTTDVVTGINRVTFATDTTAASTSVLVSGRAAGMAVSGRSV
jgi:hypothetical protein